MNDNNAERNRSIFSRRCDSIANAISKHTVSIMLIFSGILFLVSGSNMDGNESSRIVLLSIGCTNIVLSCFCRFCNSFINNIFNMFNSFRNVTQIRDADTQVEHQIYNELTNPYHHRQETTINNVVNVRAGNIQEAEQHQQDNNAVRLH